MYLLLGDSDDPCCASVHAALRARGHSARVVGTLWTPSVRLAWWLDSEHSSSRLAWDDEPPIDDGDIDGVLVRGAGWVDPRGWQPQDFAYTQSETQAALLSWLWSLSCPVVNRYPAAIWYRPQIPLLSWRPLLSGCGVPAAEALVSNVEDEARTFGQRLVAEGVAGAVYRPLTGDADYLVASDADWNGLAAWQRHAPVYLTAPHGQPQLACVVGERVVWDGVPPIEAPDLAPTFRRFAAAADLAFVQVALAPGPDGLGVVAVEPHPHVERFGPTARQEIVAGLVHLLTTRSNTATSRGVGWGPTPS